MRATLSAWQIQDRLLPLKVLSMGFNEVQEPISRPSGLPVWQLYFCIKGKGCFHFPNGDSFMREGQLVLIPPNTECHYEGTTPEWILDFILFDGSICKDLMACLGLHQPGTYNVADSNVLFHYCEQIWEELNRSNTYNSKVCSILLYQLLLELGYTAHYNTLSSGNAKNELVEAMMKYLEKHFSDDISLNMLSERFERTPEYLCTIFRRETGESIIQYLRNLRLHHARLMMLNMPEKTIKDIAIQCGFQSSSYFCKLFRAQSGMTPQAFRLVSTPTPRI